MQVNHRTEYNDREISVSGKVLYVGQPTYADLVLPGDDSTQQNDYRFWLQSLFQK